ncbi:unnamed protein product [Caenorhabditis auriculariae]|uniref:Protein kinase domain-containing protein n=1 Tax=Caenorhabditis auriculariae TaxID=2777116 RepID=A0A8S1GWW6_9PELO|nr:unnamed protein product [Caenorhabditis auriculariae]
MPKLASLRAVISSSRRAMRPLSVRRKIANDPARVPEDAGAEKVSPVIPTTEEARSHDSTRRRRAVKNNGGNPDNEAFPKKPLDEKSVSRRVRKIGPNTVTRTQEATADGEPTTEAKTKQDQVSKLGTMRRTIASRTPRNRGTNRGPAQSLVNTVTGNRTEENIPVQSKPSTVKKSGKKALREGEIVEGTSAYKIVCLIRSGNYNVDYKVLDENDQEMFLRTEPGGKPKLKFASSILMKLGKIPMKEKEKHVLDFVEFGVSKKHKLNFVVTSSHGPTVEDVRKLFVHTNFTLDCAFNVSVQALMALQAVHKCGFINRNMKPSALNIGLGDKENVVYLVDFRIARTHIDANTKLPKPARANVPFIGTTRYASRACLQCLDQGRRDDLESWLYTVFNLIDDNNGLPWKRKTRPETLKMKEQFFKHELEIAYSLVPKPMKRLVEYVQQLSYETEPDYAYIFTFLQSTMKEFNLQMEKYDWSGKVPKELTKEVYHGGVRSPDNKLSGADDFEGNAAAQMAKKRVTDRKKLSPGDCIKNGITTWKVVSLLGSGGFGDVYKVRNPANRAARPLALKTESAFGSKTMLRLKVEVGVMMTIHEARKKQQKPYRNFVEFIDRGKNDELKCKFVVMSLVGPSVEDARRKFGVKISHRPSAYNIALQTLEGIRDLHELGFLHRDIKPANFAFGIHENESTVYVLDFGICRSFLDPATKKHRAPRKKVKFLGTTRFASRACMKNMDQGRKDDIECWLFMVYDVFDEQYGIMWKNIPREEVVTAKDLFFQHKLSKVYRNIPKGLKVIVEYIDKLEFQSEPDYAYIANVLKQTAADGKHSTNGTIWVGRLNKAASQNNSDESGSSDIEVSGSHDTET